MNQYNFKEINKLFSLNCYYDFYNIARIFSRKYIVKLPKPKLLYEMGLVSLSRVRQDRLTGTVSLSQADQ